jgi:rhamnulose-1-phosphate aldolase
MSTLEPRTDLNGILEAIGEAGQSISELKASEGAAGNISAVIGWPLDIGQHFPIAESINLPQKAQSLAGKMVFVTGSGCRLRDIHNDPTANLGVILIDADGQAGHLHTSRNRLFERVTSEFNSHLAVHADQMARTGAAFHALVHAQPPYLTYLSHIPSYREQNFLNRQLLRWEPETIVNLPEGIGVLPFMVPGSPAMMEVNIAGLRDHRIVLWSKHGVMARSDNSVTQAADLIEYAETAAKYEYLDLVNHGKAEGLTPDELRAIVQALNIRTDLVR